MPSQVSSALRSRSTASCERRSRKQATSWRWPILAVVLGLFAHSEALAQTPPSTRLTALNLTAGMLEPGFDPAVVTYTVDVLSSVAQVTVTASAESGSADVTYHDDPDADLNTSGYQRYLEFGTNRITVRVTDDGAATRNYRITVTRTTTPGAPRGLRATSSDRAVRLSWTAPSFRRWHGHHGTTSTGCKEEEEAPFVDFPVEHRARCSDGRLTAQKTSQPHRMTSAFPRPTAPPTSSKYVPRT